MDLIVFGAPERIAGRYATRLSSRLIPRYARHPYGAPSASKLALPVCCAPRYERGPLGGKVRSHRKPIQPKSVTYVSGIICNPCLQHGPIDFGAPERIRTSDPQIRNLVLYPTELRALRRVEF